MSNEIRVIIFTLLFCIVFILFYICILYIIYMYSREKGKERQEFDGLAYGKKDFAEGSNIFPDTDLKIILLENNEQCCKKF